MKNIVIVLVATLHAMPLLTEQPTERLSLQNLLHETGLPCQFVQNLGKYTQDLNTCEYSTESQQNDYNMQAVQDHKKIAFYLAVACNELTKNPDNHITDLRPLLTLACQKMINPDLAPVIL